MNALYHALRTWECDEPALARAAYLMDEAESAPLASLPPLPVLDSLAALRAYMAHLTPTLHGAFAPLRRAASPVIAHQALSTQLFDLWRDAQGLNSAPAIATLWRDSVAACVAGSGSPPRGEVADDAGLTLPTLQRAAERRTPNPAWLAGYALQEARCLSRNLAHLISAVRRLGFEDAGLQTLRNRLDRLRHQARRLALDVRKDSAGRAAFVQGWGARHQGEVWARRATQALHEHEALNLLETLRTHAIGHHRRVLLDGTSLDEYLTRRNWSGLRQALRNAGLFHAEDASCPLRRAFAFGGPMFGVLDIPQQDVLMRWLGSDTPPPDHLPRFPAPSAPPRADPAPCGLRGLYHALIHDADTPTVRAAARRHVRNILTPARLLAYLPVMPLPYRWSTMRDLAQTLHVHHRHALERYRPPEQRRPVPRALCRWLITQMTPTVLVDGAWLHHLGRSAPADNPIEARLVRILADELGNGKAEHHHGNVYRQLLEQQGLLFPPVDTDCFATEPRFQTCSLILPTFLLAIGTFPERFYPEILGLNLAIELSGLGAGYLHATDDLRRHGMDPLIVQLHLSIDNLALGHAALAMEAVGEFMENARHTGGAAHAAALWPRVRAGYGALRFACLPFSLMAGALWLKALCCGDQEADKQPGC